jgi:hypothetical protein
MAAKRAKRATTKRRSTAPKVQDLVFVVADDPESSPEDYLFQDPDYREQDQERLDAWKNGDWRMVGVYAEVEVVVAGTTQTIRTPGVWAVESDSDRSHFKDLGEQEHGELVAILAEMGIPKNRVPKASEGRWVER